MKPRKKTRPVGAFSTPNRLILVKLPTFHQSQNDASNASFELSAAYYIKFSPKWAKKSLPNAGNIQALASPSAVPGHPQPLYIYFPPAPKSHAENERLSALYKISARLWAVLFI